MWVRVREALRLHWPALLVFVVAAVAYLWSHRRILYWGMDDAAITYGAALDFVDYGSLGYYVEGAPVEGYSNPLIFFVTAIMHVLGIFDPITTHAALEPLLFALMTVLLYSILKPTAGVLFAAIGAAVFVLLELVTPSTWLWYGSGLENVWVSTGLVSLVWICARMQRGSALHPAWGVVPFLVAIIRPEGPAYVAAFYGALLVFARPQDVTWRQHFRRVAYALAVTVALYLVFICWRRIAYEDWWPNTYYAKLGHGAKPLANVKKYLPYVLKLSLSGVLALTGLALLWLRVRIAPVLLVLAVASLTLPITAGEDWMGWHRFCTPYFAMTHVIYATFAASLLVRAKAERTRWRFAPYVAAAVLVVLPACVVKKKPSYSRNRLPINARDVTITAVGRWEGALRWEQQMRVGIPNAVVMMPDAGGTTVVGGMQLVDNGSLSDFQMARIKDIRLASLYQKERHPDLVRFDQFFPHDGDYLRQHFLIGDNLDALLEGAGPFWIRRDLVEVRAIGPAARLVHDDGDLRIFISDETVPFAAPRGQIRCELIVVWKGPVEDAAVLRAHVEGGDRDELSLRPYAPVDPARPTTTMQRRALLLGAPDRAGKFPISFEVVRNGAAKSIDAALTIEVSSDPAAMEHVALDIATVATSTHQAMRRFARFREQLVPRLGQTAFHRSIDELGRAHVKSLRSGGRELMRMRANARLATHRSLPAVIRRAEAAAVRSYMATCEGMTLATHVLCLGRAVDELRRYGYLGVLPLVPQSARELAEARRMLSSLPADDQYSVLVGLALATPSSIALNRMLLAKRKEHVASLPKP